MPDKNTPASGFQYSFRILKPLEPVQKIRPHLPDGARANSPKTSPARYRQGHLAFARQAHGGEALDGDHGRISLTHRT